MRGAFGAIVDVVGRGELQLKVVGWCGVGLPLALATVLILGRREVFGSLANGLAAALVGKCAGLGVLTRRVVDSVDGSLAADAGVGSF